MKKTGIKNIRQNLTKYLDEVQRGEVIVITKRDEPIAKLVPVLKKHKGRFGSRRDLREQIKLKGKPLSKIVIEEREERI